MPATEADSATVSGFADLDLSKDDSSNATANDGFTELQLSELERQILDLYDRLEELQLEISLLNAQAKASAITSDAATEQDIEAEQKALLEAKARYALRTNSVENVLIANPILKAVHAGSNATPIERDLLPLIQQRDNLSVQLTDTTSKVLAAKESLTKIEVEHIVVARKNTELATTMIALAAETSTQKKDDIKDPKTREQLDGLEQALKTSRQRWRIMKGTASAVVAGSGMDWARDKVLRELVLDNESDEE